MKILISIVSDQTIPNILFIKEVPEVDKYIFITTALMEKRKKTLAIITAAEISNKESQKVEVQEDDLADIRYKLHGLNLNIDDEYIVNITGGTKIMSLGVFNYFRDYNSKIYYIPVGKNVVNQIHPPTKDKGRSLLHKISLPNYLTAYDIELRGKQAKKLNNLLFDKQITIDNTLKIYNEGIPREILENLRKDYRGKKLNDISIINGLPEILDKINLPLVNKGQLSKYEVKYLTGDWMEEYIYSIIQETLDIDNAQIGNGINLYKENAQNELDIIFLYKNGINVIECKTALQDIDGKLMEKLFTDTLYKAAALKQNFGLWVNYYVFTMTDLSHIKKTIKDRAQVLKINLVGGEYLKNVDTFKKFLKDAFK